MADLTIVLKGDTKQVSRSLKGLNKQFNGLQSDANRSMRKVTRGFDNLGRSVSNVTKRLAQLGTVAIVGGLTLAAKGVFNVTAEFEKYDAVLTNTFQSQEAANAAMSQLQEFAAKTPFTLGKITSAYVTMVNRGLAPTTEALTAFGDFSASTGKELSQLSEALADVSNSERWKEFGVTSQKVGDRIQLTYKGLTLEAEHTTKGVAGLIEEFGQMKGVEGSMAAISKTIGGQMSNLQDSFSELGVAIGKKLSPIITPLIGKFSQFIRDITPKLIDGLLFIVDLFANKLPSALDFVRNHPLFDFLGNQLISKFETVKQVIGSVISIVKNLVSGLTNLFNTSPVFQKFVLGIGRVVQTVGSLVGKIVTFITGIANVMINFFTKNRFGIAIAEYFLKPIQWVIDKFADLLGYIGKAFDWINNLLGFEAEKIELPTVKVGKDKIETDEVDDTGLGFNDLQNVLNTITASNGAVPLSGAAEDGKTRRTSVAGGGARSVTLNIDNIIGSLEISQSQDPLEVKKLVVRALQTALADTSKFA